MAQSNVPALLLQKNYEVYLDNGAPGQAGIVPTIGAGAVLDGDFWAVPVNNGVVSGFNYHATDPDSTDKPDDQAFHVVKISQNNGSDFWYIVGTSTQYLADNNNVECCGDDARQLPTSASVIQPCQTLCSTDGDGNYIGVLGGPTLGAGKKYVANGFFNGDPLIELNAATLAAMLTQLNLNWGVVGTWTLSEASPATDVSVFVVTQTDGPGDDVLCAQIVTEDL